MEHAVPNNSYYLTHDKVYTTVKQGEVLKEWEVFEDGTRREANKSHWVTTLLIRQIISKKKK